MEFFRIKKDIPFMRHALIFNAISALTFIAAVFFLVSKGLHLSIEFTGGTEMEVVYAKPANVEEIRKGDKSLMPDNVLGDLTAQEAADLLAYIRSQSPGQP